MLDVEAPPVLNGVEPPPEPVVLTARQLLDRAKDTAEAESADGRYILRVPAWGDAPVVLRALNFQEVTRIQMQCTSGDLETDALKAVRLSLAVSLESPRFSPNEIDELFTDPAQLEAAMLLTVATEKINKLGQRGQAVAAASFRDGAAEPL